ncbi:MAG: NUDIX domain-containing protein [Clostridia bacterium]|nr:NUDIX domain-containing protein [Clostridia bacterium]
MKKEISCGCVIFDKETHSKVLIVYEKGRNFWGFPKGHIEEGETEVETALREVKEEVGLDVKILDEKYRYAINYIIEDKQIDKTSVFYIAETLEDDVTITNQEAEIEDSKWVTIDEAFNIITFDNTKEILEKVCKDIKNLRGETEYGR